MFQAPRHLLSNVVAGSRRRRRRGDRRQVMAHAGPAPPQACLPPHTAHTSCSTFEPPALSASQNAHKRPRDRCRTSACCAHWLACCLTASARILFVACPLISTDRSKNRDCSCGASPWALAARVSCLTMSWSRIYLLVDMWRNRAAWGLLKWGLAIFSSLFRIQN